MIRLYKNIKKRRLEMGLTQEQLGDATGYTRSAIAKIEHGDIDLPANSIKKFADFFGVYPGDLMSWHEDEKDEYTSDEKSIINRYRMLNRKGRSHAQEYMNAVTKIERFLKENEI